MMGFDGHSGFGGGFRDRRVRRQLRRSVRLGSAVVAALPAESAAFSSLGGNMGVLAAVRRRADGHVVRLQPRLRPAGRRGRRSARRCRASASVRTWSAATSPTARSGARTLRTDKTGKATATFKLPDSLTNWRVQVIAVSPKMHVGTATARFKTPRPVMIWPMLPRTFTEGDVVRVFGTVHNLTDKEQNDPRSPEGRERAGDVRRPSRP